MSSLLPADLINMLQQLDDALGLVLLLAAREADHEVELDDLPAPAVHVLHDIDQVLKNDLLVGPGPDRVGGGLHREGEGGAPDLGNLLDHGKRLAVDPERRERYRYARAP